MGLFINNDRYPNVFKNKDLISQTNQVVYRSDYLTEWINEQRNSQLSLNKRLNRIELSARKQNDKYTKQGSLITHRFDELTKYNERHKRFEVDVLSAIENLTAHNNSIQKLLTNGRSLDMEFIAQMTRMNESSMEITAQLGEFDTIHERFTQRMAVQDNEHENLANQITQLEKTQSVLLTRLDRQEGLLEKLLRQVDHVRSVIFERSHFIAEKIDKVNKLTSSYRAKRKTDSDRSIKLHKIDEKQNSK